MNSSHESLPLADSGREAAAIELFRMDESPGSYAARAAHAWGSFSFADFRYTDAALTCWIQELGDIVFQRAGAPSIEQLRMRYLSEEERLRIQLQVQKQLEAGEL